MGFPAASSQKNWYKFTKSSKLVRNFNVKINGCFFFFFFFFQFSGAIAKVLFSGAKTGHWAMTALDIKI